MVALILYSAAGAKLWNITKILAGDGLLSSTPLLLFTIGFESAAATYLLIGDRLWSWRLTLATFASFALASTYAIITGQDCNCISMSIGPRWMLGVDIAVLLLAGTCRPAQANYGAAAETEVATAGSRVDRSVRQPGRKRLSFGQSFVCFMVSASFVGCAMWASFRPSRSTDLDFLLADMMVGQTWPLNSTLDANLSPLESRKWLVLIVRDDCQHCRALVDEYFIEPGLRRQGERTAIFISGHRRWPFQFDHVSFEVPALQTLDWPNEEPFVASPAVFLLENGIVVGAADGSEANELLARLNLGGSR